MKEHSNEQFLPPLQLEFKTYPCFVGKLLGSLMSQPFWRKEGNQTPKDRRMQWVIVIKRVDWPSKHW